MMNNAFMGFILAGLAIAFVGNVILTFCNGIGLRRVGVFLNTSGLSMIGTVVLTDWVFT